MFTQHAEAEDVRETQSMQQRIRYYGCDTRDAKGDQMDKKTAWDSDSIGSDSRKAYDRGRHSKGVALPSGLKGADN